MEIEITNRKQAMKEVGKFGTKKRKKMKKLKRGNEKGANSEIRMEMRMDNIEVEKF